MIALLVVSLIIVTNFINFNLKILWVQNYYGLA